MEESTELSMIIDIFFKEGIVINDKNVIFCKGTSAIDVIVKCSDIKKTGSDILVYSCNVSNKTLISKKENVKIFDKDDIKVIALKHSNIELYKILG